MENTELIADAREYHKRYGIHDGISMISVYRAIVFVRNGEWSKANEILKLHGDEYSSLENVSDGPVLHFLNVGESYVMTLCECNGKIFFSSWGDWIENQEREYEKEEGVIRCGYCGEFTPVNEENYHDIICEYCSHMART